MAIATGAKTITIVNAAFLQEVKESNHELWSAFEQFRSIRIGDPVSREVAADVVNRLSDLRDGIGLQFSLEETYGFIESSPGQSLFGLEDPNKARLQHRELYLQLHEICEQAEEAQYRGTIARDMPIYMGAFEQFDDCLRAHEQFEAELIRCGLGIRKSAPIGNYRET